MGLFDLSEWATEVVEALGYLGVAMLIALENLFPPIPSEVVLPLTGFVASQGSVTLPGMIVAATIGSIVGAWVLYLAAAAIGEKRVRRWVSRWGRWFRVSNDDLDRADSWFDT
ncbi:MAG: DedA family protein, partial [Acidimicrobiia bacterium]|nr:DedA family protein [Acidimicrobiia bacterium]